MPLLTRPTTQAAVQRIMLDHYYSERQWVTLRQGCEELDALNLGIPDTGFAANLRGLRKLGFFVDKRYLHDGIYEYRLRPKSAVEENNPDKPPYEIGRDGHFWQPTPASQATPQPVAA